MPETEKIEEKEEIEIRPIDIIDVEDRDGIISKYLNPIANCPCCNLPKISIEINKAYLNGFTYSKIVEKFNADVEVKLGRRLTISALSEHFAKHLNSKGAAVAEYNRSFGMVNLPEGEKNEMKQIALALKDKRLDDLTLFQRTLEEEFKIIADIDELADQRMNESRKEEAINLRMKKHEILASIRESISEKLKVLQRSILQSKQMEYMDKQLQFLDVKTATALGIDISSINPAMYKEVEQLYLKIVIQNIIRRVEKTFTSNLDNKVDNVEKAQFFKELKNNFKGIESDINSEFKEKLKDLKEVKNQKSQ